jgi:hypothetical protein
VRVETFSLSVIGFAAFTALGAQVRVPVPWSDVPMTLQSLAVLMVGFTLGPVAACSAMLLYLGCGAAGLPVFAPGSAGLFGATGVSCRLHFAAIHQRPSRTAASLCGAIAAFRGGRAFGAFWLRVGVAVRLRYDSRR